MKTAPILGIFTITILLAVTFTACQPAEPQTEDEFVASIPPNLLGSADAPVKIVEYADFACPTCRSWHNAGVLEALQDEFGEQISFEFRHYPVISLDSPEAGQASQCAAEQGKFWEYHDYLYEDAPFGELSIASLKEYATAVNLNQTEFDECLDSKKYQPLTRAHWNQALEDGARGTPTFYVNGIQTPPMLESLAAQIEAELGN